MTSMLQDREAKRKDRIRSEDVEILKRKNDELQEKLSLTEMEKDALRTEVMKVQRELDNMKVAPKEAHIVLEPGEEPKINLTGMWFPRDYHRLSGAFVRAIRLHKIDIAKENKAEKEITNARKPGTRK